MTGRPRITTLLPGALAGMVLASPAPAQELREVTPVPDYGAVMHPGNLGEDLGPGDGPEGTKGNEIPVPSGQKVWWIDVIHNEAGPDGLTYRFRFLAPQIGGRSPLSSDIALKDIEALCNGWVVPRLPQPGPEPAQVMVSLSDQIVPFGDAAPEVVQYFDSFSVEDGNCVWEFF
ncbi:hypothetical protein AXZ77_2465 [Thioclava sp. ES.031]|uniref:DUF6497 family protein n=1 Tax=Thioclava sp. ES.031 TaxID=1798203 RepID=UPI000C01F21D|nr:DUF6497 family protein [Thioclava sp. ES.031]PFG63844.1 hypothetical protein AXZ77_2465 [Thioclava sp. ES.031]